MSKSKYIVYMVNFDITKGYFDTLEEAISVAKDTGFQCTVSVIEPGKRAAMHVCSVRP